MRLSKRRLPVPQWEFSFTQDTFNLFAESALDGERITREREETDRARLMGEAEQAGLFTTKTKKRSRGVGHQNGHQIGHQTSKNRLQKIVTNSVG